MRRDRILAVALTPRAFHPIAALAHRQGRRCEHLEVAQASLNERMHNPHGDREQRSESSLHTPTSVRTLENLARRLFSCPSCGARWVVFTATGLEIVGVRPAGEGDAQAVVCCEYCLANVDGEGGIAGSLAD